MIHGNSLNQLLKPYWVKYESRYESFGTAGNASKLKPIPLTAMARRYNAGELDQINSVTIENEDESALLNYQMVLYKIDKNNDFY